MDLDQNIEKDNDDDQQQQLEHDLTCFTKEGAALVQFSPFPFLTIFYQVSTR